MSRHLLIAGACVAALSLAACGKKVEAVDTAPTPAEQAMTPDANPAATYVTPSNEAAAVDFVPKAAASDMFEIEAAKLAQKRSTNAKVKAFAAEMISAHTATTAALKKAIADSGQTITPPATLPDDLKGTLDDLTKVEASNFDKAYLDNQVDAHQTALNLMQRYAEDGDIPAIKSFAAATAPDIQKHFDMAKALRESMN